MSAFRLSPVRLYTGRYGMGRGSTRAVVYSRYELQRRNARMAAGSGMAPGAPVPHYRYLTGSDVARRVLPLYQPNPVKSSSSPSRHNLQNLIPARLLGAATTLGLVLSPDEAWAAMSPLSQGSNSLAEILMVLSAGVLAHVLTATTGGNTLELVQEGESGAWKIEGLEESRLANENLLREARSEIAELEERLKQLKDSAQKEPLSQWQSELGRIEKRATFWDSEIAVSGQKSHQDQARHIQDIQIGLRLLLGKINRLGATLHAQSLPEEIQPEVGLRNPRPVRVVTPGVQLDDIYPGLKNYDVGFGEALAFRSHQVEALKQIEGWLKQHQKKFHSSRDLSEEKQQLMQGTIVMPVGGGKTRAMIGSFALAMEQGLFRPGQDKFLILNHTTEIHEQNLEVAELLGDFFQKKYGRPLKVSSYKAREQDLSGDVVVISIPSVAGAKRRERLTHNLLRQLGPDGRIAVTAVDEVHHLGLGIKTGKETWPELLKALRAVTSNFYRLGFTATPAGHEGAVLYRVNAMELMQAGVTPRTYMVKVPGIDLTDVAIRGKDFASGDLERTLLSKENRYKRNTPLYQSLERYGIRQAEAAPSGRERLSPVLGFGADLKHAQALMADYIGYFEQGEGGLKGRRFLTLGEPGGEISEADIEAAIESYENGEVDGIVALVSGNTKPRNVLFEAVKSGKIEGVFSVDALVEGADLYMFTHQLGARPTFSPIKKGQERGRINRRCSNELTQDGVIASDPPKLLFDVVDEYHRYGHALMSYGLVMGLRGHTEMETGELYDLLSGDAVEGADLLGRTGNQPEGTRPNTPAPRPSPDRPRPTGPRGPRDAKPFDWSPLATRLREILETDYVGNLEDMAWDLGETPFFTAQLLDGNGFQRYFWFFRRMSTLLYRSNRDELLELYNQAMGASETQVTDADYVLLHEAMKLIEQWEGKLNETGLKLQGKFPWGAEQIEIYPSIIFDLDARRLGEIQWHSLWLNCYRYLATKEGETAGKMRQKMLNYLLERNGWLEQDADDKESEDGQKNLLMMTRRLVAQRFGGTLPFRIGISGVSVQNVRSPLRRWLEGEKASYSRVSTAHVFYGQVAKLLGGLGADPSEVDDKIEAAIFTEHGWSRSASTQREKLLLLARKKVAQHFGGSLPIKTGIEGVSFQGDGAMLRRWLEQGKIDYSRLATPDALYGQIEKLLEGLGVDPSNVTATIEAAIFEERGWSTEVLDIEDELLLLARKRVARQFGGRLPQQTGISGVPMQSPEALLARWLNGEKIEDERSRASNVIFVQIRKLLEGLGVDPLEFDDKLERVTFEKHGWSRNVSTKQEELLLLARKKVAQHFGGYLPTNTNIEGVPEQRLDSLLNRWLKGDKIVTATGKTPNKLREQIKKLLEGLGVDPSEIGEKIEAAIFEEQGWSMEASTKQEELLLLAREKVAQVFGGHLPNNTGIKGLPPQGARAASLTRWLHGEKIVNSTGTTPQSLYEQIKKLLEGLGLDSSDIDGKLEAAIFEEQGWPMEASNKQEALLLLTRKKVAQHYRGRLPQQPGISGVSLQGPKSILTRWLNGEEIQYGRFTPKAFYDQIQILLEGLGLGSGEANNMIEEAIFEEQGWSMEASNKQEELLLLARKKVAKQFGGRLSIIYNVIDGIVSASVKSSLDAWLQGSSEDMTDRLAPRIRALLTHEYFMSAEEADRLIAAAKEEDA